MKLVRTPMAVGYRMYEPPQRLSLNSLIVLYYRFFYTDPLIKLCLNQYTVQSNMGSRVTFEAYLLVVDVD